eukprot:3671990-Alexandrium_andersonii.AAC.1
MEASTRNFALMSCPPECLATGGSRRASSAARPGRPSRARRRPSRPRVPDARAELPQPPATFRGVPGRPAAGSA